MGLRAVEIEVVRHDGPSPRQITVTARHPDPKLLIKASGLDEKNLRDYVLTEVEKWLLEIEGCR